jgi:hypothetical protein
VIIDTPKGRLDCDEIGVVFYQRDPFIPSNFGKPKEITLVYDADSAAAKEILRAISTREAA